MKFSDFITEAVPRRSMAQLKKELMKKKREEDKANGIVPERKPRVEKIRPETVDELCSLEREDFKRVDIKHIEKKINWDEVEIDHSSGTPQQQGRYNDTVISATIKYGKEKSPWCLEFILRGDAKVSQGWRSTVKFKGIPTPEYVKLEGNGWRSCKFVDSDEFHKLILTHAKKDLKEEGLY